MEWVLDTSIAMAWCFEDERTPHTEAMLDRLIAGSTAVVPQIWPLEVANVLALSGRKSRITPAKRRLFLTMLAAAPISVDMLGIDAVFNDVLMLADKYGLTSYDASYLELAMRLGLPLATLDRTLHKAAKAGGVQVL